MTRALSFLTFKGMFGTGITGGKNRGSSCVPTFSRVSLSPWSPADDEIQPLSDGTDGCVTPCMETQHNIGFWVPGAGNG